MSAAPSRTSRRSTRRPGSFGSARRSPRRPGWSTASRMASTKAGATFRAARLFLHGTTVAINTILERTGARCALLTTQGFRDIYEIGRVNRPESYNLFFRRHEPLIERDLRFEIRERMDCAGQGADPARRGRGARGGRRGGGAGRAGDRHPVPALLPQSRARAARQGDHQPSASRAVRHGVARTVAGVPRVRAHLDGGGQCLCRSAGAALSRRNGRASRRRRLRRRIPDRAIDRRAVRRRGGAVGLHPDAGIRAGRGRDRHQGAVRQHRAARTPSRSTWAAPPPRPA